MIKMEKPPKGYFACTWCGAFLRLPTSEEVVLKCPNCKLNPLPDKEALNAKSGKTKDGSKKPSKSRKGAPKMGQMGSEPVGLPVIGVDPGARYTGVVIRDGDVVMHATTLVRPKDLNSGTEWALVVVAQIQEILKEYPRLPMGIEGISDPKGFQHGKKAAINPKDIIRAGIVLGAVVATWPDTHIIDPGGNGSQHVSHYPKSLIGRRDPLLPGSSQGAGTRGHEQSAYDVAGKTGKVAYKTVPKPLF